MSTETMPTPPSNATASTLVVPVEKPASLPLAVIGGAVAALGGAAVWAAITVATKYQIGYMAVGVGFLVGFAVRFLGRGSTQTYGVIGALFSLLGCAAGNLLSAVGFFSLQEDASFFAVLTALDFESALEILKVTFSPMDVLFYAIAISCGYKYSMVVPQTQGLDTAPPPASP
jgi:hypothetical protein